MDVDLVRMKIKKERQSPPRPSPTSTRSREEDREAPITDRVARSDDSDNREDSSDEDQDKATVVSHKEAVREFREGLAELILKNVGAEEDVSNMDGDSSSEDGMHVPAQKRKKSEDWVTLTPDQEQTVCDWLKEFPQVWNTRHEHYRKTGEKDLLWEEQGQKMGLTGNLLKRWYRSTRSKFGRVKTKKNKSVSGSRQSLTFREEAVWQLFQFLGDFVKEKANRESVVSLRKKIAAQAPAPAPTPPPRETSPECENDPAPRPIARGAAPPLPEARDTVPVDPLVDLQRQGAQLMAIHQAAIEAVTGMKGPHKERSAYCDYLNQCSQQLDQDLWSSFKKGSFRFMESLLEQQNARQNPQPQLQPVQTNQQMSPRPGSSSMRPAPAETTQWQPPPHRWPQQLATQTDVWGSQVPAWMARNIVGFVPSCPPPDQQPDAARPSSCPNVPGRLSELSSFNMSGFGGSQVSQLNTPTFRRSVTEDEAEQQEHTSNK